MLNLSIDHLQHAYRNGTLTPTQLMQQLTAVLEQADTHAADTNKIWISRFSAQQLLDMATQLEQRLADTDLNSLPLYGIPFAVKDNIDLLGLPTTAGCADFAYQPTQSATVVQRLIDAGAIPIGKTNLDQFATGLNGTRSPYGIARNSVNPAYIAGGSSSGSALAVALGQVSFSLGTDTAGSGRVPAAFNGLVGLKPSCGLLSTRGVVPACRSLDCVSIFSLDSADAATVLAVAAGYDAADPYSRDRAPAALQTVQRIGIPAADQLQFFGDAEYAACFDKQCERLLSQGYQLVEIDFSPFLAAAKLLYSGAWVAERYHALQPLLQRSPESVLPVIRQIVEPAAHLSAVQTFDGFYQLAAYKRQADQVLSTVDLIMTPTAGRIFRVDEMLADPIALNNQLGYYTNFMNLLDYAALAIPSGTRADGLPFGVTVFADAGHDHNLLAFAQRLEAKAESKTKSKTGMTQ